MLLVIIRKMILLEYINVTISNISPGSDLALEEGVIQSICICFSGALKEIGVMVIIRL